MCTNLHGLISAACNRKKTTLIWLFFSVTIFWVISSAYSIGPAKSGTTVTGAPFNNSSTCSNCHGGGNFGGSITTQLLDATSKSVSQYIPGQAYTFRISLNKTTGSPSYGFQTTVATSTGNTDINKWGLPPANTHVTFSAGHNYLEQSKSLTTNIISIPWTAPAAGTGSLVFYTAGNIVNGTGGTTGDQPVAGSLTVAEGTVLSVKLLYFNGSVVNGHAQLKWETAQEINSQSFIVEKSSNGIDFKPLVTISSKGTAGAGAVYSFTDMGFSNAAFYRLKETNTDGSTSTFNTVNLKSASAIKYSISFYNHAGLPHIIFYNASQLQKAHVLIYDLNGRRIAMYDQFLNEGDNQIGFPANVSQGIYSIAVITQDSIKTSIKIAIVK